jgi:DNA excision repair protein ERCC-2
MQPEDVLFPFDTIRPEQDKLITAIFSTLVQKKNLVVHAPTGLGKTAAALAPAVSISRKHDAVVFFLTSRHTQHAIALATLKEMEARYGLSLGVVDLIGKKHFCLQPQGARLKSADFYEYCSRLREDGLCEYYTRLKEKEELSSASKATISTLAGIHAVEEVVQICGNAGLCPYEVSLLLAKNARVIIADYNYVFQPRILQGFLKRTNRTLGDLIIILDEAHNIAGRLRESGTVRISTLTISRAMAEAKKFDHPACIPILEGIARYFTALSHKGTEELSVERQEVLRIIEQHTPVDEFIDELADAAEEIRASAQHSSLGALSSFLSAWQGPDEGYVRVANILGDQVTLSFILLDPSLLARQVINQARSTILMSGTLTPTSMFRELLGVERCTEVTLPSPFPDHHRLNMIIPETTTQYAQRNATAFREIARHIAQALAQIPGNVAVYFPSFKLRDDIARYVITTKTSFVEEQHARRQDKEEFLERFKSYKATGAVLFAVINGNFSEGIDLPGDELRGVIIVGLPLTKPTLEIKAMIAYYDKKFGKGWEYGYVLPAFTKAFQCAGRCIRSSTDTGVVVFIDERYAWKNYFVLFPQDWRMKIAKPGEQEIGGFFTSLPSR